MQNLLSDALKFRREDVEPVVRIDASADGGQDDAPVTFGASST
jgi:hypothetical protein